MKRLILLAVAAAIAGAGCAKHYETNPVTQGPAIGFGTWTETLTKRDAGSNTFVADDQFKVYGFKTNSDASTAGIFNGDVVTAGTDATTWSYSPVRYFDPTATKYTFFAISEGGSYTVNQYEGLFVGSSDLSFAGNDQDVLVAEKKEVLPAAYGNKVELVFRHIASQVNVQVKKDAALNDTHITVQVTGISLTDVINKGTYHVTAYTENVPAVTWVAGAAPNTATYTNASITAEAPATVSAYSTYKTTGDDKNGVDATTGDLTSLLTNQIVMPQNLNNGQKLNIAYKIVTTDDSEPENTATTEYTASIAIKDFYETDAKNNLDSFDEALTNNITLWEPGKKYVYTITINANKIDFSASVTDWTTVNGYRYLVQ